MKISSKKDSLKKQKRIHEQYKQSLKENALFERPLVNMCEVYSLPKPSESKLYIESFLNFDARYTTSKSEERRRYEENVTDKDKFQEELKRMMIAAKNHESFEIDIDDDSEIQYAFTKILSQIRKMKTNEWRPLIYGYGRVFNLNKESDLEDMIRCVLGEITIEEYSSDTDPFLMKLQLRYI